MSLPISHVTIFKKTGLVLWSRAVEKMRGDPVSQLIQNYLLEEKGGAARRATIDAYDLEWRFVNEGDLVVVVASQRSLELDFCGDLVDLVRKRVVASGAAADADKAAALRATFDATYDALAREMEAKLRLKRKKAAAKAEEARARREEQQAAKAAAEEEDDDDEEPPASGAPATEASGLAKLKRRASATSSGGRRRGSAKAAAALDFSGKAGDADARAAGEAKRLDEMRGTYLPSQNETAAWDEADELVEESDDDGAEEKPAGWFGRSALGSLVANVSGTQTLTRDLVDPAMEKLRTTLMEKNVAVEVADAITATVSESLVGKKVERFARAKTLVRDALKDAVARVL